MMSTYFYLNISDNFALNVLKDRRSLNENEQNQAPVF